MNNKSFAVLTGDLIGYSLTKGVKREKLQNTLKDILNEIEKSFRKQKIKSKFGIYRGDSFQGLIPDPSASLECAIKIKSYLRSSPIKGINTIFDARIAIGIGKIDNIKRNISESDGEAFRLSGPALDELTGQHRIKIKTPYQDLNDEFNLTCHFLDVIINRWTPAQAEVIYYLLNGLNQISIAEALNVSQAAINQRIASANWHTISIALKRFKKLISQKFK